ncbi:MAG: hypothetical protein JNM36_12310 [Chitinophagales bacterium]|mgnify:CR=1 FL=1|jgi:hypothetical protein|nr:hypothetical protein [Chitinophagales bacterium]
MGYSNFKKIRQVVKRFDLDAQFAILFEPIVPKKASEWLIESLRRSLLSPPTNEKSKAERIVSPILLEIVNHYSEHISFFSGEDISVNPQEDLAGECDFFFALHPAKPYIDAPIITLTESKDEDMEWGMAQCAAQMLGAKLFNQKEGKNIDVIYGCATDGIEWQFMRLQNNTYYIHPNSLTQLTDILGAWHQIIQFYLDNYK